MAVDLAPDLLEILVCPNCHSALAVDHDRSELVCTGPDCALAYPVRDQIPILLIDEARAPERAARAGGESSAEAAASGQPDRATQDAAPVGDDTGSAGPGQTAESPKA